MLNHKTTSNPLVETHSVDVNILNKKNFGWSSHYIFYLHFQLDCFTYNEATVSLTNTVPCTLQICCSTTPTAQYPRLKNSIVCYGEMLCL